MTLTLLDKVTPGQPPTDGVRELLAFVAVTAVVYLCGVLALAVLSGAVG